MNDEQDQQNYTSVYLMPIIAAIGVNILILNAIPHATIDWLSWSLFYVSSIVGGLVLASIANALRLYVMPHAVLIHGGFFDILFNKIFWAIGPQLTASMIIPMLWFFRFDKLAF